MGFMDFVGVTAYLVVVWVVSATVAGAVLWGGGLLYYAGVRTLERIRGRDAEPERPGMAHPTRKHGRRILPAKPPQHVVVRHRVFPLF
ncbi:hypothetical protein EPO15_06980 [bacterium]|nr:MAG: hypothetical protein EPO15_06980 [bacterium]